MPDDLLTEKLLANSKYVRSAVFGFHLPPSWAETYTVRKFPSEPRAGDGYELRVGCEYRQQRPAPTGLDHGTKFHVL